MSNETLHRQLVQSETSNSRKNECSDPVFQSREEMNKSLSRGCYGNLNVIGRVYVEAMKSVLTGSKMCLIPTVEAAKPKDETPKKPPKMKYKDLPLYERPHYEYKQYLEDEQFKCLKKDEKLLHKILHPTIVAYKRDTTRKLCDFTYFLRDCYLEAKRDLVIRKNQVLGQMRCPNNLNLRRGLVIAATATGWIFGSKKNYIYQKTFWATMGALITGYLCFPKETDQAIRDVSYEAAKVALIIYNFWYNTGATMGQIGPCEKDKPPIPPKRVVDKKFVCPVKVPPKKPKPPPPPKPPAPPKKRKVCHWE